MSNFAITVTVCVTLCNNYFEISECFSLCNFFKDQKKSIQSLFVTICNKNCYCKQFRYHLDFHCLPFLKLSGEERIVAYWWCHNHMALVVVLNFNNPLGKNLIRKLFLNFLCDTSRKRHSNIFKLFLYLKILILYNDWTQNFPFGHFCQKIKIVYLR